MPGPVSWILHFHKVSKLVKRALTDQLGFDSSRIAAEALGHHLEDEFRCVCVRIRLLQIGTDIMNPSVSFLDEISRSAAIGEPSLLLDVPRDVVEFHVSVCS